MISNNIIFECQLRLRFGLVEFSLVWLSLFYSKETRGLGWKELNNFFLEAGFIVIYFIKQ